MKTLFNWLWKVNSQTEEEELYEIVNRLHALSVEFNLCSLSFLSRRNYDLNDPMAQSIAKMRSEMNLHGIYLAELSDDLEPQTKKELHAKAMTLVSKC